MPSPEARQFHIKLLGQLNTQAAGAGVTAFALYLFGPVPLQVAVAAELGLTPGQTAAWISVGWLTSGLASIWLSLRCRVPIAIVMSAPAVIYLGTLGDEVRFAELVGANLVAGALILVLALLGAGRRIATLIPLPIVLAMFAGSLLEWVFGIVEATFEDVLVAGSAIVAYAAVRRLDWRLLPPVPVAAAAGAVALVVLGRVDASAVSWVPPSVDLAPAAFSVSTAVAVGLPLAVLSFGLGTVQGIGFLRGQGYEVPADAISVASGGSSLVNAALGATPASIGLSSGAIVGGPEAGPREGRSWAGVIAGASALAIAVAGGTVASLLGVLPPSYVAVVAGLAVWSTFRGSVRGALEGELRAGAVTAFLVAATPFAVAGITSAFWAIPAGLAVSLAVERCDLLRFWREARHADVPA